MQHNFSVRLADETRYMNAPTCRPLRPPTLPLAPALLLPVRVCVSLSVCVPAEHVWHYEREVD